MKRVCLLVAVILFTFLTAYSFGENKNYKSMNWEELFLNKKDLINENIEIKGYGHNINDEGFILIENTESENSIYVNMVNIKDETRDIIVNKYNKKMKLSLKGVLKYDDINDRYQIVVDYLMY